MNLFHVQWLKLILGVLIPFGIYRYREILIESFYYATQMKLSILFTFLFVLISISLVSIRLKYLIKKQGGLIKFWTAFKCYFISLSPIFSMIRFSDSIKIYYLKKKGILLSQAMTAYLSELIIGIFVTGVMLAVFLGQYTPFLFIALSLVIISALLLIKFSHKLPNFRILNIIRDFSEDLKKIIKVKIIFTLLLISFTQFVFDVFALSTATGASLAQSLIAVLIGIGVITAAPTIAGIGFYETAVPAFLISIGISSEAAVGGVFVYRFFTLWLPALIGNFLLHKEF